MNQNSENHFGAANPNAIHMSVSSPTADVTLLSSLLLLIGGHGPYRYGTISRQSGKHGQEPAREKVPENALLMNGAQASPTSTADSATVWKIRG